MANYITDAENLCRAIEIGRRPFYLLAFTEWQECIQTQIGYDLSLRNESIRGYFAPNLDQLFKPALRKRRVWRGRGPVVVIRNDKLQTRADFLNIALHELAHVVECSPGWEYQAEGYAERQVVAHGARWLRTLIHLVYRAKLRGHLARITDVATCRSDVDSYRLTLALGNEPRDREHEPLGRIINSPAPRIFTRLARQSTPAPEWWSSGMASRPCPTG